MLVKVLLFAQLRRAAGAAELQLDVSENATVSDVARLVEQQLNLSLRGVMTAVGERYATPDTVLRPGDELALLPPVAGGHEDDLCQVTDGVLDLITAERYLVRPEWGAQAYFVGTVRSPNKGKVVDSITYEAYAPMAEREMQRAVDDARAKHPIGAAFIQHRTGTLRPGEASILIGVASAHRRAALEACDFLIERLKVTLPVWKLETDEDGASWVEGTTGAPTLE